MEYKGQLTWFPTEVVEKMLEHQVKNFDRFFQKYPKSAYPKVMLVNDKDDIETAVPRVVFTEKLGIYFAWVNAKTLEDAEKEILVFNWKYAWDLPKEEPVTEISADEALKIIAEAKGINIEKLRIKK